MIYATVNVTIGDYRSTCDNTIVLYRGDKNVEIRFVLKGNKFTVLNSIYAQMIITRPSTTSVFSEIAPIQNDTVILTISEDMIDELTEVGCYDMQIRLYDDSMKSRVTMPPVEKAIEVKEPIAIDESFVDTAMVGYARARADSEDEEDKRFDENGNYIKTYWEHGDIITAGKLNKVEDSLEVINANDIQNHIDVNKKIDALVESIDAAEYVTETELNAKGYLTEHQDISGLATKEYVDEQIDKIDVTHQLTDYAKKSELHNHSNKSVLDGITASKVSSWDNKSNFDGNYNSLTNKPSIPSIEGLATENYVDEKLENIEIPSGKVAYGTCSTEAATAEKTVVVEDTNWELEVGSMVAVKFSVSNSASNVTINVNGTGAYPIWASAAEYTSTSTNYTGYANRTYTYIFNGTHWVWMSNGVYPSSTTNASLGHGYGVCSTAEATLAKSCTISSYTLSVGGSVSVKFTNAVPANSTLNIRTRGAKKIFYKGAAISDGVIKAGDTATFVYDGTQYQLISIDSPAFNGDYNSLTNKPNIPSTEGLATEEYVDSEIDTLEQYVKDEVSRLENDGDIVNSVEEMTNTSKQYVLSSTNTWWKYKTETLQAGSVLPGVDNAIKWDTCEVVLNKRLNSSVVEVDAPGSAIFYFTFTGDAKMTNMLTTIDPVWIRMKGCSMYTTTGNSTSTKINGWDSEKTNSYFGYSPYSQALVYEETKNGISNTPYAKDTLPYTDNKTAPVTAMKYAYHNDTIHDNSTNKRSSGYYAVANGTLALSLIVNFANTNPITEADLENVYITFNEPIISYETQTISEWYDTGIEYNPNADNEVVELQTKVTSMETKINKIEDRVEILESKSPTSGGTSSEATVLPDYWISRLNDIGGKIDTLQKENGMDTLQFLWCSDIHGVPGTSPSDTTHIGEIGRYMMDKYNVPFFMVSGDIMSQGSHGKTSQIWAEYDKLTPMLSPIKNEEFLAVKGNHDGAWGSPMEYNGQANQYYHSYIGDKELFNAFMRRQTLDSHRRVFDRSGMYFYIDYHDYRIYMLNSHTFGDDSVNEQGQAIYNGFKQDVFGSKQLQWVADTLMTVKENQQVIFVAHAPITYMVDSNVFANMIASYRRRLDYTASVDVSGTYWASGTEYSTSSVTKNFANAKGDFIGYFNGHIHQDTMSMVGVIPMISITTAGGDVRDKYYTDGTLTRTKGTATETAIDIVTITSNYIYCSRIGSGYDRKFNRLTNEVTIDYDSAYIPPEEPQESLTQGEITSEVTWKENTRLSSGGGYAEQSGVMSTSEILVKKGDIIRIYGMPQFKYYSTVQSCNENGAVLSNLDVAFDNASTGITGNTTANTDVTVSLDGNKVLSITILNDKVYYIRVSNHVGDNMPTNIRISRNAELIIDYPEDTTPINYFDTAGEGYVAWDGSKMYTNFIPYRCAEAGSGQSPVYHIAQGSVYKFRIIYPDKTTTTNLIYVNNANQIGYTMAEYNNEVRLVQHDFSDGYGQGEWYIQFECREDCASTLTIQIDQEIE